MGRDVIEEFLALADTVRVARDLAARESSIEQACAESEKKLAELRTLEETAVRKAGDARLEAKRVEDEARENVRKSNLEWDKKWSVKENEVEARCAERIESAHALCDDLEADLSEKRVALADLQDEESKVAQSVTALKAELDALRARVLG